MEQNILRDTIDIFTAGEPVTTGIQVTRPLTLVEADAKALVQTTTLANAVESRTDNLYSIKVSRGSALAAGMVVQVKTCQLEPSLVGKKLLVDKVSQNGAAMLRKAVAGDWTLVQQQGKESI